MLAAFALPFVLLSGPPQSPSPSPAATAVAVARKALDEVLAGEQKESRAAADAWRNLARAHGAARQVGEAVEAHRSQLVLRERFTVEVLADGSQGEAKLRVTGKAVTADDSLATAAQGRVKGGLHIFTDRPEEPELLVDLLYILRE